ncbi:hypothetical protein D3C71_2081560 [compost metagenome]
MVDVFNRLHVANVDDAGNVGSPTLTAQWQLLQLGHQLVAVRFDVLDLLTIKAQGAGYRTHHRYELFDGNELI